MYITDTDEVITLLRSKLPEYLQMKLGKDLDLSKKFNCFSHDDKTPSMGLNPRTNNETVKCFSCGFYGDIFTCAEHFDQLPLSGSDWLLITIPTLCDMLDIPYSPGVLSEQDKERIKLFKLAQDISDIMATINPNDNDYMLQRNWIQTFVPAASLDKDELVAKLVSKGWDSSYISNTNLISTRFVDYFGSNKVTFSIKDHAKRTVGFICRNQNFETLSIPKYTNSPESTIYKKNKALMGIDVAYRDAKKYGLYVVEGPGDLMQLYRLGIKNAVSVCGTAFT